MILDDFSRLLRVREALELGVPGRAQLEGTDAERLHVAAEAGEVAVLDPLSVRPGLTSDRQAQWIHQHLSRGERYERGRSGSRGGPLEELSSRDLVHLTPLRSSAPTRRDTRGGGTGWRRSRW